MNKPRVLLAVIGFAALYFSVGVAAPALDAAGKCRDNGKFVNTGLY